MEPSTCRSLAFLFSLGALPVACKSESHDTTDGGTGGASDATDGATSTAPPTTSTGGATMGDSTTGPGTSEGTDTTTGGALEACEAYVAYRLKCDPGATGTEAELLADCTMVRDLVETTYGPTCLALHDAVNHCLAASDCDAPDACAAEMDAANGCLPEAGPACVAFAAKEAECSGEPVPAYAAGSCQAYINNNVYYGGAPCGSALEEWYVCLVDLPCPQFQMRAGCEAEQEKIAEACGGE
ncbi:hypothetical protein [Nannocystis pusilla]|uniref:Lipoprotein n=1 Tax=Nannocystis pusilla TaxID=889268 RepID=A0ABS7TIX3_9BACT|nr:hypothetical protein [Nannocystis pusilla]MBZ5708061.1 hypothetical protein [Nannocystis pusilla]